MKVILLLLLINILAFTIEINEEGHCPLVFNVKKYNINKIPKIDSYFINFNTTSINSCAEFCGKRHFCRTADFNPIEKSCSISYKQTLNCYTNYERFSSYQIDTNNINNYIYRISCANYCNSKFNSNPHSSERTQEHKNVINSINKDDDEFGKYINGIPKIIVELQKKLGGDTEIHTQLIPVERKIEEKVKEIEHKNGSLTRQVKKIETEVKEVKGQLIKLGEQVDGEIENEEKVKGIINYVEKNNNKQVNVLSDNLSKSLDDDILNKIPSMRTFKVISSDTPLPIQRFLLQTPKMKGIKTEIRGDSITYDLPNEPIVINGKVVGYQKTNNNNAIDIFYNSKEYNSHEFNYSSKENIDVNNAIEYCYRVINQQELMYAGYKTIENISLNECRCSCAESWLTMKDPVCLSIQYYKKTSKCILNKGDHHGRYDLVWNPDTIYYHTSCTKEVFLSTIKSICNFTLGSPKNNTITSTNKKITSSITKKTSDECFEVIDGYNMIGVGGGMESNVTLEECKCFCAHGKALNRYNFQCLSATYFHDQGDCVLNIADRELRPEGFVKNYMKNYNISYIGMTCPFNRYLTLDKCKIDNKEEKVTKNTDDCFIEMPSYVLEGTAMALETNVTVEECKCYCIDSENRYGIVCQSFQYYYDSSTCLLNNQNKNSNSEKFTHNTLSDTLHSYFHYTCTSQKNLLSKYTEKTCTNILDQKLPKVSLKDEKNKNIDGDLSQDSRLSYSNINHPNKEEEDKIQVFTTISKPVTVENSIENNNVDDNSNEDDNNISTTTDNEEILTKLSLQNIGPCTYNALYNRLFNGNKLIKRIEVNSPIQCFQYCHINKCRSANLMLSDGNGRICELYKDSIIDYRRSDILEFARGGAHFDTIKCQIKDKISN